MASLIKRGLEEVVVSLHYLNLQKMFFKFIVFLIFLFILHIYISSLETGFVVRILTLKSRTFKVNLDILAADLATFQKIGRFYFQASGHPGWKCLLLRPI
jgi:hypothetical protein